MTPFFFRNFIRDRIKSRACNLVREHNDDIVSKCIFMILQTRSRRMSTQLLPVDDDLSPQQGEWRGEPGRFDDGSNADS